MSARNGNGKARWRLESVTITNFRGVNGTQEYRFDGRPVLVWGDNGVGKSTLALGLEWTLFGAFPSGTFGVPKDAFLCPVGSASKSASGEIVLVRGGERIVIRRTMEKNGFGVTAGGKTLRGDDAERLLEERLGLDRDTFVRAVLLQQGRIRGLLLDEPKERNKALDRLLGMDAAELLLDCIKPKAFKEAAAAWRESIRETEARFENQAEMLEEEYRDAKEEARAQKFLGKDLSTAGLAARYEALGRDLVAAAARYGVKVEPLPAVEDAAGARRASAAVARALAQVRRTAEIHRKLAPIEKSLGDLHAAEAQWEELAGERDEARKAVERIASKHGDPTAVAKRAAEIAADVAAKERSLRAAGELRSLLTQAGAYLENEAADRCPVCEQTLADPDATRRSLARRIAGLTSQSIRDLETELAKAREAEAALAAVAGSLRDESRELAAREAAVENARKRIMTLLGSDGLLEKKVAPELAKAIQALASEQQTLARGAETMEKDLEAIAGRDRAIRDGLVPFLETREKVARHERRWKKAKEGYAKTEQKAAGLERLATDVESIRTAILAAKQEIADQTLGEAGPRAQELYRKLVQHPFFDRLDVRTSPRANKVDYSFEVSHSKEKKSAREARLVLSDGQMTAAALALFFGLAESTGHAVDVLYVDDPTQNLDHARKEAMAKVVADLATRRQVVVSTQDEDFVALLRDAGFDEKGVVHHIEAWDRAPKVATTLPEPA